MNIIKHHSAWMNSIEKDLLNLELHHAQLLNIETNEMGFHDSYVIFDRPPVFVHLGIHFDHALIQHQQDDFQKICMSVIELR
jgi:hypothetical protein